MTDGSPQSRRQFLASSVAPLAAAWYPSLVRHMHQPGAQGAHPVPRPGIDASRVPRPEDVGASGVAPFAFREVREIPHIVDGIRCHCGCASLKGYYSLLSCYEGADPMAKGCDVCQGQARYAYRLHKSGKSLREIRAAIDARFGDHHK